MFARSNLSLYLNGTDNKKNNKKNKINGFILMIWLGQVISGSLLVDNYVKFDNLNI